MSGQAAQAMESQAMAGGPVLAPVLRQGLTQARKLGVTLAAFMTAPDGKQVAAVSIDNFDTHANQGAAQGQLASRLAYLDAFIDGLASGLGPAWPETVVITATEFGIIGDWPTLRAAALYENRDTAPTLDMRALFKGVLRDHLGLERAQLDSVVFPGSAAVAPLEGLVA
jgi:uncharacterized protein (DUF1501 family)